MSNPRQLLRERINQSEALRKLHRQFLDSLGIMNKRYAEMEKAGVSAVDPLLGPSPESERVREKIRRLAKSDLPVLVHGPPGTAKNVVAALIHFASPREGVFRQIDVASVPDRDAAEFLFGCVAGHRGQSRWPDWPGRTVPRWFTLVVPRRPCIGAYTATGGGGRRRENEFFAKG